MKSTRRSSPAATARRSTCSSTRQASPSPSPSGTAARAGARIRLTRDYLHPDLPATLDTVTIAATTTADAQETERNPLTQNLAWMLSQAAHVLHTELHAAFAQLGFAPRGYC